MHNTYLPYVGPTPANNEHPLIDHFPKLHSTITLVVESVALSQSHHWPNSRPSINFPRSCCRPFVVAQAQTQIPRSNVYCQTALRVSASRGLVAGWGVGDYCSDLLKSQKNIKKTRQTHTCSCTRTIGS